jgi:porin
MALDLRLLLVGICLSQMALADPPGGANEPSPLRWSFSSISEVVSNLQGGITRGSVGDYFARLNLWINGPGLRLPKGSQLKLALQGTESGDPSARLVGDAQGVSDIAAPSQFQLYELWYGQTIGRSWNVRLGLLAADHDFDLVNAGRVLANASFGTQPTWSLNTVPPIYPTPGLGATATWSEGGWTNRAGIFQADPADRASAFARGALLIDELAYGATGTYKLGVWNYRPRDPQAAGLPPATWGSYLSLDHPLRSGNKAPSAFLRLGVSPTNASTVDYDLQTGILVPGPFRARPKDQFSFGIALAHLKGLGTETVCEATYQLSISPHVFLQPDLQYVNNPDGSYPSAFVAILRLGIALGD